MGRLSQKMEKERYGDVPLWPVPTVHRKFLLKTSLKNWPYKQRACHGVTIWDETDNFLGAFQDSYEYGTKFLVCVKLENMVAIHDQSRLDHFRKIFPSPIIWTFATGPSKNPLSVAENEIFVPELEYDSNEIRETQLRLVFQICESQ